MRLNLLRTPCGYPSCPVLLCLILLLLAVLPSPAQIPPLDVHTTGRTYVIAFPDTTTNLIDDRFPNPLANALAIYLYSAVNNQVTIVGRNYRRTIDLIGGKFEIVYLNNDLTVPDNAVVNVSAEVSDNTFRVEAREPVILYCSMQTKFGSEIWTPVPVERWGMEYRVAAMPGEHVADMYLTPKFRFRRTSDIAPAEMLIVAAYDATTVTIRPSDRLMTPGAHLTITLNANQAYQLQSLTDTSSAQQSDLGGTQITANRPIGVLSGNTRAQVRVSRNAVTGNTVKNMLMEWLAPVEQYGTEFVYLPTWDSRRLLGHPSEKAGEKRLTEVVRFYSDWNDTTLILRETGSGEMDTSRVPARGVNEFELPAVAPAYFRSQKPVQAMMTSTPAIVPEVEATALMGLRSYDTWGTYMVELIPREQWTTFAPFYAPLLPDRTEHYINVVAHISALDKVFNEYDAPFDFNMGRIPGTDFMWGTEQITPGQTHFLMAREGATFFAYQYGTRSGYESFYPDTSIRAPEYREIQALSYGFPLAPRRRIFHSGDSLLIETAMLSCRFNVKVRTFNPNPVGLRSAELAPGARNTRLDLLNPSGGGGVIGFSDIELDLLPVDPRKDASATLVITDRTGKTRRVEFTYTADNIGLLPAEGVEFSDVSIGDTKDTVITIRNTSEKIMCINNVRLRYGNQAFTVVSTSPVGPALVPAVPVSLPPGGEMQVRVAAAPQMKEKFYVDTLRVSLCCSEESLPLRVAAAVPCIDVGDLNFGVMNIGQRKTLGLRICNQGRGYVTFDNPSGDTVITWLEKNFTMQQSSLDSLRAARLGPGECITLPVTFMAQASDTFHTVARLWASTRDCRDTSVWRAVVRRPVSGVESGSGSLGAMRIVPNPSSGRTTIGFTTPRTGHVLLEIYNSLGETIATLADEILAGGEHLVIWDASAQPAGLYYCRLISEEGRRMEVVMVRK